MRSLLSLLCLVLCLVLALLSPDPGRGSGGRPRGPSRLQIQDPYAGPWGRWYTGQVHCHSTIHKYFCSADSLRDKVEKYRDAGLDFVCLTDHNFITRFQNRPYAVVPTLDPHVEGIHFISGAEIGFTLDAPGEGPLRKHHIGAVGCDWTVAKGETLFHLAETETSHAQAAIDSIRTLRYAPDKSALPILNHPEMEAMFDVRFYPQNLLGLTGQAGIEVYNTKWARSRLGSKSWQNHGASHWDYIIRHLDGERWGFATDDAHHYIVGFDYLGGWIAVQAPQLTTVALLDAVRAGRFIACVDSCEGARRDTTSAVFTELGVRGNEIVAASDRPSEFSWWTDFGHEVRRRRGVLADTFRVEGWESAVRVRVRNEVGAAYSQPFFVENPERDEDRWQLRLEKKTRLLVHFNEGQGPVAYDAAPGGTHLLITPTRVPPISEWLSFADTVAYRDSIWGGWLHNGVGTVPDETDLDRDRWGYALRGHRSSVCAEAPVRNEWPLFIEKKLTVEFVGAITEHAGDEQPLLVNESRDVDGRRCGWRVVVAPAGAPESYRFYAYDEDGNARVLHFGEELTPGEVYLVAIVLEGGRGGAQARAFIGGVLAREERWDGMRVAWRTQATGSHPEPFSVFTDPYRQRADCAYHLRELRITAGARSDDDIREDAERLLLAE